MDPHPPDDETDDQLYDAFVEAALRGEGEDPDAFCARHGRDGGALRQMIDGLHRMLATSPAIAGSPMVWVGGTTPEASQPVNGVVSGQRNRNW